MNRLHRIAHCARPLLVYLILCGFLFWLWGGIRIFWPEAAFIFGLFWGFALAVVLGTLWVTVAGPLQELVLEHWFDPPQPEPTLTAPLDGPQGVLVSDIHIDTWGPVGSAGAAAREQRFLGLLAAIKADSRVDSFYMNGDLMDAPLHPDANAPEPEMLRLSGSLAAEQGVLLGRYNAILDALLNLTRLETTPQGAAPIRRAIFQTGNHDIGVSGLRYVQPNMPPFLPAVQTVWNPSLLLQTDADDQLYPRWVYIEHGHHWDPLLWLYMRYALLDILRFGHRKHETQLLSGLQRGGKVGMGTQTFSTGDLPSAPPPGTSANHFPNDQPQPLSNRILSGLIRLRYRQAARRTFRDFQSRQRDRRTKTSVRTILIGHTHHPDRYVFPGGLVYINSGDWSGYTQHCAYCVLDPDGTVRGPFQWESAAKAEFGALAVSAVPLSSFPLIS